MDEDINKVHDQISAQRIEEFIKFLKLTPIGMAAFLKISTDHMYSLRKGRRSISDSIAKTLATKLGITEADVYNSNFKLKQTDAAMEYLKNFTTTNSHNPNFFLNLKNEKSLTFNIRTKLVEIGYFDSEKRVYEVVQELAELQIKVNSEKATKSLLYLVETGYLTFQRKPFIKKDGSESKLHVNHYIVPQ